MQVGSPCYHISVNPIPTIHIMPISLPRIVRAVSLDAVRAEISVLPFVRDRPPHAGDRQEVLDACTGEGLQTDFAAGFIFLEENCAPGQLEQRLRGIDPDARLGTIEQWAAYAREHGLCECPVDSSVFRGGSLGPKDRLCYAPAGKDVPPTLWIYKPDEVESHGDESPSQLAKIRTTEGIFIVKALAA